VLCGCVSFVCDVMFVLVGVFGVCVFYVCVCVCGWVGGCVCHVVCVCGWVCVSAVCLMFLW